MEHLEIWQCFLGIGYPVMAFLTAAIWLVRCKDDGCSGYYGDDATRNMACLGLGVIWPISLTYLLCLLSVAFYESFESSYRIKKRHKEELAERLGQKLLCKYCGHPNDKDNGFCGFCGQMQVRSTNV